MFLRPNYRRPCRCVACGEVIDNPESYHNWGFQRMCIVTGQDLVDDSKYKGFDVSVQVTHCEKCRNKSSKAVSVGCLVGIAFVIIGIIVYFTTHNDGKAVFLGFLGFGISALVTFAQSEPKDAEIIHDLEGAGFNVGTKFYSKPKVHWEMTPDAIRQLLAELCVKHDYVLTKWGDEEVLSVDILRDKGIIAGAVVGEMVGDIVEDFDLSDIDMDLDLDIDVDVDIDIDCDGGDD